MEGSREYLTARNLTPSLPRLRSELLEELMPEGDPMLIEKRIRAVQKKLRRVRGGAESIHPPQFVGLAGRPFSVNETINIAQKRAIAQKAVELCEDGDAIIINGGTTTFQMVHPLATKRCQVFTNSFPSIFPCWI